jgi:hypothetical protein
MNTTILLLAKDGCTIRATLGSLTKIRFFWLGSTSKPKALHSQVIFGGSVKYFFRKEVERWIWFQEKSV